MVEVTSTRLRVALVGVIAMSAYWLLNADVLQRRLAGNAVEFTIGVAAFVLLTSIFVARRKFVVLLAWGVLIPLISGPIGYLAAEIGFFIDKGTFGSQAPAISWIAIAIVFPLVVCKLWTLSVLLPALIALDQGLQPLIHKLSGPRKGASAL